MNVNAIGEFIGALLILMGGIMSVISVFGLLRLPDVYTRSHAATKSSTLAVLLTLLGAFHLLFVNSSFHQCTSFVGDCFRLPYGSCSRAYTRAGSYRSKVKLADISGTDDLYEVLHKEKEEE